MSNDNIFLVYKNKKIFMTETKYLENLEKLQSEMMESSELLSLIKKIQQEATHYFPDLFSLHYKNSSFYINYFLRHESIRKISQQLYHDLIFKEAYFHKEYKKVKDILNRTINKEINNISVVENSELSLILEIIIKRAINKEKVTLIPNHYNKDKIFSFLDKIEKSDELISFLDKFKYLNFYIKNIDFKKIATQFTKNIDHISNLKNIFDNKTILSINYMLKHCVYFIEILNSNQKIKNIHLFIEDFSFCAKKDLKRLLFTLKHVPFLGRDHFSKSKKMIKKMYGLNNFGFNNFIKNKYRFFYSFNPSFSTIDLNDPLLINNKEYIAKDFFKNRMEANKREPKEYNDLSNFEVEYPFIKQFKNKLNKIFFHDQDGSNYDVHNEYSNISLVNFDKFIEDNNSKRIFPLKKYQFIYNNLEYYSYSKTLNMRVKNPFNQLSGQILKNIFFKRENKFILSHNVFFSNDNYLFFNDKIMFKLFLFLSLKQIEILDTNDLYSFSSFIYNNLIDLYPDFPNAHKNIIDHNFLNCFKEKLSIMENINDEEKTVLHNSLIDFTKKTLNSFYLIEDNYLINFYHFIIYRLTNITLSVSFASKDIQAFCIEFYLISLFENHYSRKFNNKSKTDLKYISKFAEKYHSSYENLLEKSFNYTYLKFMKSSFIDQKNEIYNKLNIEDNINYNKDTGKLIFNNFEFKPLVNLFDIVDEGEKMRNCLRRYNSNTIQKDQIVFSVTHRINKKFRINFELTALFNQTKNINNLLINSVYTYCNNKNELLNDEFEETLMLFKDSLMTTYLEKNNLNKINLMKKISILDSLEIQYNGIEEYNNTLFNTLL